MSPWFYEAPQCHNVLLASAVSQWPLVSMRPCRVTMALWFHGPHSVTMVSMIPWGLAMPQWSPWIHGALQDHHGPVAARGPVMQQWPLGSTKPCCFTLGPWDHGAQQCHNDVLGAMGTHTVTMAPWIHGTPRCHNGPFISPGPKVSQWSPQEGHHGAPVFQGLINFCHQRPRPG